ncbi:hypothetical protein ASL20_23350 [Cupriavidus necator]|nr:hypothetical protein ASL20_23350 [Cupriavidus necator]
MPGATVEPSATSIVAQAASLTGRQPLFLVEVAVPRQRASGISRPPSEVFADQSAVRVWAECMTAYAH